MGPEGHPRLTTQQQVAPRAGAGGGGEEGRDQATVAAASIAVASVDSRSRWCQKGGSVGGVQGQQRAPGSSAPGGGGGQSHSRSTPSACLPAGCGSNERHAVRAHLCLAPKRLDGWTGDTRDDEDSGRSSLSRGLTLCHLNSKRPAKILFESAWGCGRGRHPKVMMPAQVGS